MSSHDDCHICGMAQAATPETAIYQDNLWTASMVADVPGWTMLLVNRHAEGPWELTAEEAAGFGPLYVELADAIRKTCDAERVYLMYLGENALHFHALLVPRRADAPPELRGPEVVSKAAELADRESALHLAAKLREHLSTGRS